MNILIKINTDSELIGYEAVALAFLLASFDHTVQLYLMQKTATLLTDPTTRLYGMIQSLDLYDMPAAWADLDELLMAKFALVAPDLNNHNFDSILIFD